MKKITSLIVLSTLFVAGCSEDDAINSNPTQNDPVLQTPTVNPFEPVSTPVAPNVPVVANDAPVTNPPVQQPPVTQQPNVPAMTPPVSTPVTVNPNSNGIVNGSSEATASSIWVCDDIGVGAEGDVLVMAFFGDGNGLLSDGSDTFLTTWTSSGPYVELTINGQYFARFDNIAIGASSATLTMTYVLTDGSSGALDCERANLDGSSGGGSSSGVNDTPISVTPEPPANGDTPDGFQTTPASQSPLVNMVVGEDINDAWACLLYDGTEMALIFMAAGQGGLVSQTYSEGILMSWAIGTQGVTVSLADGNQLVFSSPQFSGSDYFQVDTVNYLGRDIPGMACQRETL
ncbi:MAG: hypothetical protein AB8B87_19225 [Granulosicoccus sp.]